MSIEAIHHVNIRAPATDIAKLREFYCEIVGLRDGWRPPFKSRGHWLYAGPHPVVTVELVEQPALRLTSTVVDCATDDIAIGMQVELTWIERDGVPFPAFRPASAVTTGGKS